MLVIFFSRLYMVDIYKIGLAYDMPSAVVNGMQCEDMHDAMTSAVARARKGEGPTFLEVRTYRYRGHSMSDPAKYRTKEEVENYKSRDPLEITKQKILELKYASAEDLDALELKIEKIVLESVEFAETSKYPDPSELYTDVYAEPNYPFAE